MNILSKTKLRWTRVVFAGGHRLHVPDAPGIYSIGRATDSHGLVYELDIQYIGKTMNLRRRFQEHLDPFSNHPKKFGQWPVEHGWVFEYARASGSELDKLERSMIQDIEPAENQIMYAGGKND